MLDSVAYIGYGFVGKACHRVFQHNAGAIIIDPKYSDTTIKDLEIRQPRLTFVAINAPTLEDGTVDASVIYTVFQQLSDIKYDGLVVLKSTLPPDVVHDLYEKFGNSKTQKKEGPLRYIYSPEFLREKHWEKDALNPHHIIIAGDYFDCRQLEELYKNHSHIRYARFRHVDYKTASLIKYSINSYLASKVVFMNQLHQLYLDTYGVDTMQPESWKEFTDILSDDIRIGASHMEVPGNDGQYGYGGSCFPKDVKALIEFDKKERLSILREVEISNTKIRLTGSGKTK